MYTYSEQLYLFDEISVLIFSWIVCRCNRSPSNPFGGCISKLFKCLPWLFVGEIMSSPSWSVCYCLWSELVLATPSSASWFVYLWFELVLATPSSPSWFVCLCFELVLATPSSPSWSVCLWSDYCYWIITLIYTMWPFQGAYPRTNAIIDG